MEIKITSSSMKNGVPCWIISTDNTVFETLDGDQSLFEVFLRAQKEEEEFEKVSQSNEDWEAWESNFYGD